MALVDCISEEAVVLIQRDKTYRPFKLRKGRKLNFEKISFYPDSALGHRYGSCFKVVKQNLELFDEFNKDHELLKGVVSGPDNRNIHDDGTSQELTAGDVRVMKDQGISAQGIIASMVEHSNTFKDKTKYSQEKYIKKKEKKYNALFRIIKPTTKLLCKLYLSQTPTKIYFLREDTLAQILTQSNVHANSNMIVMETCQGFMVGAMLERMGGFGKLVQIFHGDYPVRTILDNFGHLSPSDKSVLMTFPLHKIGALLSSEESKQISEISKRLAGGELEGERRGVPIPKWRKEKANSNGHQQVAADASSSERLDGASLEPPQKKAKIEVCDDNPDGADEAEEKFTSLSRVKNEEQTHHEEMKESGLLLSVKVERDKTSEEKAKNGCFGKDEVFGSQIKEEITDSISEKEKASRSLMEEEVTGKEKASRSLMEEEVTGKESLMEEGVTGSLSPNSEKEKVSLSGSTDNLPLIKEMKRREREEAYEASQHLLTQRRMDGLVVVCRHHPEPIVMSLIKFLSSSRPLVVYCPLLEPLVQCYKSLKESEMVFNLNISETWTRNYQVLQERTHPEMMMEHQSGYILTGTRVNKY